MRLVVDAITVIALSRIRMLDFLQSAANEVLLPEAADEEVARQPPDRPGVQELAKAGWLRSQRVVDTARVTVLRQRMGHGETEAGEVPKA